MDEYILQLARPNIKHSQIALLCPLESIFILSDELIYGLIYTMAILKASKGCGRMNL
jgi:hypothetical protein